MGAFNTLRATAVCPSCRSVTRFEIQFKYGRVRQLSYALGDAIAWGGGAVGRPGSPLVAVEGLGGPCPRCGGDNLCFEIRLENDRLVAVRPSSDGVCGPEGYRILD